MTISCSSSNKNIDKDIFRIGDIEIDIEKKIKDTDGSAYAGTWLSITEEDTLIVILKKGTKFFKPFNRDVPRLFGTYDYSEGSNSQLEKLMVEEGAYTLEGGSINKYGPRHYVGFTFKDTEMNKSGELRLYLDEDDENVLHWHLFEYKWLSSYRDPEFPKGFSVPDSLTLVRVGWN